MKENARQGYWNGVRPPFGYTASEVEQRASRIKKKLAIGYTRFIELGAHRE